MVVDNFSKNVDIGKRRLWSKLLMETSGGVNDFFSRMQKTSVLLPHPLFGLLFLMES